jgi:hypothetical protein
MLNPANLFTALIGNGSEITTEDVIRYKGDYWLALGWKENSLEGWKTPSRIVRLEGLQPLAKDYPADFFLSAPIPKQLFDLSNDFESIAGYSVIDQPDLKISTRKPTMN